MVIAAAKKLKNKQDECDRLTAVAMKQTFGRQVVSTVPVKHILLLQCGPQAGAGPRRGLRAGAGPCTLGYTNVVAVALAKTAATVRKCAFSPNCWGTGGG